MFRRWLFRKAPATPVVLFACLLHAAPSPAEDSPAGAALTELREWTARPEGERSPLPPERDLAKDEARAARELLRDFLFAKNRERHAKELEEKSITIGDRTLLWLEKVSGEAPPDGRGLWISLHGGGGAPARVNDSQWRNQLRLYTPEEGFYVAPRAPGNTWDLWHQAPVDALLGRLVAAYVAERGVNPNKVYLMGYSAGGDGVYQLAPRLAWRFAAASMMAGHPNDARPDGLRNLPFGLFMGGEDHAYNRNKIAREWEKKLADLAAEDPGTAPRLVRVYEGLPHWMQLKDAESVPWMAKFTRDPWPRKVVWVQDDVTHSRFYWLEQPEPAAGQRIVAQWKEDERRFDISAEGAGRLTLLLSDDLLDLDQPFTVTVNGKTVSQGKVPRRASVLLETMKDTMDAPAAACARLELKW